MEKLMELLTESGIPFVYHHFAKGEAPAPPFICYLFPDSDHFYADGQVYYRVEWVHVELYTTYKDLDLERRLEALFDRYGIAYDRAERWIESESLYEVLYQFEMEG